MAKKIILIFLFVLITPIFVLSAIPSDEYIRYAPHSENSNDVYSSSRFTQKDDLSTNTVKGIKLRLEENVTQEEREDKNYDVLLTEKNGNELYYNSYLHIFKVRNSSTGYVWSTGVDHLEKSNASVVVGRQISSLVILDYYFYNAQDGTYSTTMNTEYLNKVTGTDEYTINPNNNVDVISADYKVNNEIVGKKLTLNYSKLGIRFNVYVYINDNGSLSISVPNEEIEECLGTFKNYIANIKLAPALGSNVDGTEPGYFLIPDGCGSLIRYGQKTMTAKIIMTYYGYDFGINPNNTSTTPQNLTLPVYGFVNGINQDGCLAVIENGDYLCDLVINLNGAETSKYNFMTPRFKLRNQYLLYGINQATEDVLTDCDIKINYLFVEENKANYVGLANTYQEYLIDKDILELTASGEYKIKIEALMSEAVKAIIGTNVTTMTKLSELEDIISELKENDVEKMMLVLLGWNSTGFSGSTPYNIKYNSSVASKSSFKKFNDENEVYYYNDYVYGYDKGDYSQRSDVARSLQRLKLSFNEESMVTDGYDVLYPESSLDLVNKNLKKYKKLNISNLALDNVGSSLFTTYDNGDVNHKNDTASIYQTLFETLETNGHNLAMYSPYAYSFKYMKYYFQMPLYSCQCNYYTDNVPFLPYVLRGAVDYYSSYTNFFANQEEQLLRSLDYGSLPSYIITSGQSRELKYTDSYNLYTTVYDHWKNNIINNYSIMKNGYETVSNNQVISRNILSSGVVEVVYANGSSIQIDYKNLAYKVNGGESEWIFL